jgi:hypothetical protein
MVSLHSSNTTSVCVQAKELAEAARAQQQLQQPSSNGGPAGAQDAADDAELPDAQRLQAAIRKKLQQLTPCKRKVEQEVLLEKSLQQQVWRCEVCACLRTRWPAAMDAILPTPGPNLQPGSSSCLSRSHAVS